MLLLLWGRLCHPRGRIFNNQKDHTHTHTHTHREEDGKSRERERERERKKWFGIRIGFFVRKFRFHIEMCSHAEEGRLTKPRGMKWTVAEKNGNVAQRKMLPSSCNRRQMRSIWRVAGRQGRAPPAGESGVGGLIKESTARGRRYANVLGLGVVSHGGRTAAPSLGLFGPWRATAAPPGGGISMHGLCDVVIRLAPIGLISFTLESSARQKLD